MQYRCLIDSRKPYTFLPLTIWWTFIKSSAVWNMIIHSLPNIHPPKSPSKYEKLNVLDYFGAFVNQAAVEG